MAAKGVLKLAHLYKPFVICEVKPGIGAGLLIKDLAGKIGVTDDSVTAFFSGKFGLADG